MGRLILVPQFPVKMRYQEWWFYEFPKQFSKYFTEVIVLGSGFSYDINMKENFLGGEIAVKFECYQIQQYMSLNLQQDDVLLLNDLSYPGLFTNALLLKKPNQCFAICHATSKNKYDCFSQVKTIKYPVERSVAKLFDKVFVATEYHRQKLGWYNLDVIPLPVMNFDIKALPNIPFEQRLNHIVSISRRNSQKVSKGIEKFVEQRFGEIVRKTFDYWQEYYKHLSFYKIVLITSKEETFGYQILDTVNCGCVPLAPYKCSYPEMLPKEYLYQNKWQLRDKIFAVLSGDLKPVLQNTFLQPGTSYNLFGNDIDFYEELYKRMVL